MDASGDRASARGDPPGAGERLWWDPRGYPTRLTVKTHKRSMIACGPREQMWRGLASSLRALRPPTTSGSNSRREGMGTFLRIEKWVLPTVIGSAMMGLLVAPTGDAARSAQAQPARLRRVATGKETASPKNGQLPGPVRRSRRSALSQLAVRGTKSVAGCVDQQRALPRNVHNTPYRSRHSADHFSSFSPRPWCLAPSLCCRFSSPRAGRITAAQMFSGFRTTSIARRIRHTGCRQPRWSGRALT